MADQATIDDIIDYYTDLLIVQYNRLPKARAMIALFIEQLIADGIIFDVRDGYDIETAVGAQLDVLAKYIGADRFFTSQALDGYFSFTMYTDPGETYTSEVGFCTYDDFGEKPGSWLTYDGVISQTYSLTDPEFRTLLKLKILQNNSNHSDQEINDGVFALFGDALKVYENYNMIINYVADSDISSIVNIAAEKGILPKPMGVALNLIQGFIGNPVICIDATDGSDDTKVIKAYQTLSVTGSGTIGTHTITASASVDDILLNGAKIRIGVTDVYTVASFAGTTITTVEILTSTYPGASVLATIRESLIYDTSGYSNNTYQNTVANQPIYLPEVENGIDGMGFNGSNTLLTVKQQPSINNIFTSGGTVVAVVNQRDVGDSGLARIYAKTGMSAPFLAGNTLISSNLSGGFFRLQLDQITTGTLGSWRTTNNIVPQNSPAIIILTYSTATLTTPPNIYVNSNTAEPITTLSVPTGSALSDENNPLIIGNRGDNNREFDGTYFAFMEWKKILSTSEITAINNYFSALLNIPIV